MPLPPQVPVERPERDFEWYDRLADMLTSMREKLFQGDTAAFAKALGLRYKQLQRLESCDLRLTDREADKLGATLHQLVDAADGKGN